MKYEFFASFEIEPDLKSAAIMKATDCEFSHVGIIEDGRCIFQATGIGFHSCLVEEFEKGHGFAHRFEIAVIDPEFAAGWLRGNLGKDYSESQLLGFALRKLKASRFGKYLLKFLGDGRRELICSESVVRFAIECCGLSFGGDPDYVTPQESVEIMRGVLKA